MTVGATPPRETPQPTPPQRGQELVPRLENAHILLEGQVVQGAERTGPVMHRPCVQRRLHQTSELRGPDGGERRHPAEVRVHPPPRLEQARQPGLHPDPDPERGTAPVLVHLDPRGRRPPGPHERADQLEQPAAPVGHRAALAHGDRVAQLLRPPGDDLPGRDQVVGRRRCRLLDAPVADRRERQQHHEHAVLGELGNVLPEQLPLVLPGREHAHRLSGRDQVGHRHGDGRALGIDRILRRQQHRRLAAREVPEVMPVGDRIDGAGVPHAARLSHTAKSERPSAQDHARFSSCG